MSDLEKFNFECLYAHNQLRAVHGAPPLNFDDEMAKSAQKYAEYIASRNILQHSKKEENGNCGENLAMSMRPFVDFSYSGLGATVSWYSEIKDYDFSKEAQNKNNEPTGHFTQVIWKGSQEAGFGRAKASDNAWYVVGRYRPAGNFMGQYKENVPPLPNGVKWDKVSMVEENLEEMRTMEYTNARKHILDNWMAAWSISPNNFAVTETFTTPSGSTYTGTETYTEDPRKKPRPEYPYKMDDSVYSSGIPEPYGNHHDDNHDKPDETEEFIQSVVKLHNVYRSKHGSGNLKLDDKLSAHAQDWAEELAASNIMKFSNYLFQNSQIGENITEKNGKVTAASAKDLVDSWYNEGKSFTYQKEPSNFKNVGHFTQMVWKNSKMIGVGVAETRSGKNYVVCFYHPPGNLQNKFNENISKPK